MKLFLVAILALTAVACDKTIHECRSPDSPQPALANTSLAAVPA